MQCRHVYGSLSAGGYSYINNGTNLIVEKLRVLSSMTAAAAGQKDSAENKYFGDVEKISEDEITLVSSLGKEKLLSAYL